METVPNSLDMNSSSVATEAAGTAFSSRTGRQYSAPPHQLWTELLLLQISPQNLVVDILNEPIYRFPNDSAKTILADPGGKALDLGLSAPYRCLSQTSVP